MKYFNYIDTVMCNTYKSRLIPATQKKENYSSDGLESKELVNTYEY